MPLDAFLDRLQVRAQQIAARHEQLLLVLHLLADQRIAGSRLQIGVESNRRRASLLGQQPPLHRTQPQVTLTHGFIVGPRHRRVQRHQHLALLDFVALAHQHFLHNAAAQVLHRLALGVDSHHASRRHALIQRGQARPQQESPKPDQEGPQPHPPCAKGFRLRGGGLGHQGGQRGVRFFI